MQGRKGWKRMWAHRKRAAAPVAASSAGRAVLRKQGLLCVRRRGCSMSEARHGFVRRLLKVERERDGDERQPDLPS